MAGVSVIGAILAIIGTAVIVSLSIYGGFILLTKLEDAVNDRAFRKAIDQRLDEIADGDRPFLPDELFHSGTNNRKAR
jgi:hypothetical protein